MEAVAISKSEPPGMMPAQRNAPLPRLEIGEQIVALPERGQHIFLEVGESDVRTSEEAEHGKMGLWLFRAESGVCGVIPGRLPVTADGIRVSGLAILHHGMRVQIGDRRAVFYEVRRDRLNDSSRLVGRKCPSCHDAHEADKILYRCPLCGEGYCEDCWAELEGKRCYSRNCDFSPGRLAEG